MLIDAAGNEHEPAQPPCRIVSLVPSLTELLFALDLQGELVGRTDFCIEPEGRIEQIAVVGGTKTADMAKLLALTTRPTTSGGGARGVARQGGSLDVGKIVGDFNYTVLVEYHVFL